MGGYAGDFSLTTPVGGHAAGTVAHVTVSILHPAQLVLAFDDGEVMANACVLLCGHVGALALLELGYTGPLVRRPAVAAGAPAKPRDRARAARPTTEPTQRT